MSVSCWIYRQFIDPLLSSLRMEMASRVRPGESVLEAACGTGAQALAFVDAGARVLAFDLSEQMVECTRSRSTRAPADQLNVIHADGRDLPIPRETSFDWASVTLALHEMPIAARVPLLRNLSTYSRRLLIADYAAPLPTTGGGVLAGLIERLAGGDHFAGFRSYTEAGGLESLMADSGLRTLSKASALGGVIEIREVEPRTSG